jgi:hypothetical protein
MQVQGAAISLGGSNMMVTVVDMGLVENHGEADMAIESLSAGFGGVTVILMAQRDDGSPVFYGDQDLVGLLRDVPVEEMPWREYSVSA